MDTSIFPIDIIRITQLQNGGYSHQGVYALDLKGLYNDYPVHAPFKGKMVRIMPKGNGASLFYQSIDKVKTPTGERHLTVLFTHTNKDVSWFQNHINNQTVFDRSDIIYWTGISGNVTGDHLHLEVADGYVNTLIQNSYGNWMLPNAIRIESAFYYLEGFNYYSFINGLTIDLIKTDGVSPPVKSEFIFIRKRLGGKMKVIPIRRK